MSISFSLLNSVIAQPGIWLVYNVVGQDFNYCCNESHIASISKSS